MSEVRKAAGKGVYVIYSPTIPGWIKIGVAATIYDRVRTLNQGSPHRDFECPWFIWSESEDNTTIEDTLHEEFEKKYDRKGEWFKCPHHHAIPLFLKIAEKYDETPIFIDKTKEFGRNRQEKYFPKGEKEVQELKVHNGQKK